MNRAPMIFIAVAALSTLPLVAQQSGTTPQTSNAPGASASQGTERAGGQESGGAVPVTSTADSPEATYAALRPVKGELQSKVDSKSAKAGDSVVVKTTESATTSDGIVIPKGSKIVGHVTDVQAKGKGSENSRVTIQFDQAELKGRQNLPIRSVLQSIAPAMESTPGGMSDAYPSAPMGGAPASGGMNPGGAAAAGAVGPSQGAASVRPDPVPNGGASGMTSTSPNEGTPAVGTIVARNGNVAIRTTAVPGVLLANNADGQPFANASGALLGAKQDVRLASGTHVVVAVAGVGTKSGR